MQILFFQKYFNDKKRRKFDADVQCERIANANFVQFESWHKTDGVKSGPKAGNGPLFDLKYCVDLVNVANGSVYKKKNPYLLMEYL